jgi:hypothetical protein
MSDYLNNAIAPLNIFSNKEKKYLSYSEFYKIIEDEVYINKTGDQFDEVSKNYWKFELQNNIGQDEKESIKNLYRVIINARSDFVIKNYPELKMVFYTWYEGGDFCLSLTQTSWERLPFDCQVHQVDSLDDIIQEFLEDPRKGKIIPIEDLVDVDPENDNEDDADYIINLWSVILPLERNNY